MLSISISQPVVWSPAPAPAVAAVSSAVAVTPVQATARDGQAGMGQSGRESAAQGQAARAAGQQDRNTETDKAARKGLEAAPLLPRPQPDERQGRQEADTEKLEEQKTQQAEEAARKLQLQDVIVNAWKASAAVVDVALGRDLGTTVTEADAAAAAASPVAAADAAKASPLQAMKLVAGEAERAPTDLADEREVVAYDAQGHSSLAPLEAGSLISRRV